MDGGTIDECRKAIKNGCTRCCRMASFLFPGENLGDLPEGVKVRDGRVYDCMGVFRCKFEDVAAKSGINNKPLFCMMAPVVQAVIGKYHADTKSLDVRGAYMRNGAGCSNVLVSRCPIVGEIPYDFRKKVIQVLQILEKTGVWSIKSGVKFSNMSEGDLGDCLSEARDIGDPSIKCSVNSLTVLRTK